MRKHAINIVAEWSRKIRFPATIIIVGSYARGDYNFWSDIDVLLIADSEKPLHRRLEGIDYPPNLEIIFLTPKEFMLLLKRREPLIVEALSKGIFIRDDYKLAKLRRNISYD